MVQITSTSANHLANIAKEEYMAIEENLNKMRFYNEKLTLLSSGKSAYTKKGWNDFGNFVSDVTRVCNLKAFIACLREQIKRKDFKTNEVENRQFEFESKPMYNAPSISKDDIIESWSLEKQCKYYRLDAICAVIGKLAHPEGPFSSARKELARVMSEPLKASINGSETVTYEYEPSIELADVNATFFEYQRLYRENQATLNSLNTEIEDTIREALRNYDVEWNALNDDYYKRRAIALTEFNETKRNDLLAIKNSKIEIPDNLSKIYAELSAKGKN